LRGAIAIATHPACPDRREWDRREWTKQSPRQQEEIACTSRVWLPDLLLAGGLMAVAAAVRLPYLHLVPVVTDEAFEVQAALGMVRGGPFIWFGPFDPTTGPLVTWLLALAMWLFGPGAHLARVVTLLFGVATVGLTYFLGRSLALAALPSSAPGEATRPGHSLAARVAGVVAAALLAFNPVHTIVNSHVAWSNSATSLFAAAAFLALHVAGRRGSETGGIWLVLGGFLVGLALQTHISVLVVIPGLLIWFLARRDARAWLRTAWPTLAMAAALLGYGNMIVYNLTSSGGVLANVRLHTYAWESNPTLASALNNAAALLINGGATLGGQVPRVGDPLAGLAVGLAAAWLLSALVITLWRGERLPGLVILSTILIMPYFNKRYEGLLSQRYTAFLLPLCFAAMGALVAEAVRLWQSGGRRAAAGKRGASGLAVLAVVGLALIVAVYPLRNTLAYYAAETEAGRDNRLTLELADHLAAAVPPDTALYLSLGLKDKEAGGGYRFVRALAYYLAMEGLDQHALEPPEIAARLAAAPDRQAWLVLTAGDYQMLAARFTVEPVAGGPPIPNGGLIARYLP
jgi:4-amino-4-deoxy-L-arabinose transferase-like glycosyltransferase